MFIGQEADFDVLAMLKTMDRHLEAIEYEKKFKNNYRNTVNGKPKISLSPECLKRNAD